MASKRDWRGLQEDEIRRIELLFCPCINRVRAAQSVTVQNAASRCGWILGRIQTEIGRMRDGASPDQKALATVVRDDERLVSNLFKGKCAVTDNADDAPIWDDCRNILMAQLLGVPAPHVGIEDPRYRAAMDVCNVFFGEHRDSKKYFAGAGRAPRTWREAMYEPLDLARTCREMRRNREYEGDVVARMLVVSGGPAYGSADANRELGPLGDAALCAILCDVQVVLVFPEPDMGETDASNGAKYFYEAAMKRCRGPREQRPRYLKHLMDDENYERLVTDWERLLKKNLRLEPLDPFTGWQTNIKLVPDGQTREEHERQRVQYSTEYIWAGAFLNPIIRFVYFEHRGLAELFLSRSKDDEPFSLSTSEGEHKAFRKWRRRFLNNYPEINGR